MTQSKANLNSSTLYDAIVSLEIKKEQEFLDLKTQLDITYESLRPINIINQTLVDLRNTPEIKHTLVESLISISGGYLSKKLLFGKSTSVFKKILGYVIQYGITNFISKKVRH